MCMTEREMEFTTECVTGDPEEMDVRLAKRAKHRRLAKTRARKPMVVALIGAAILLTALMTAMAATQEPAEPVDTTPRVIYVKSMDSMVAESVWNITDDEEELVALAIMAVARGESEFCMKAVAQTIRNTCEDEGMSVEEVIAKYHYPIFESGISAEVQAALASVVDGEEAINERLHCFYNPNNMTGKWHETKEYVVTIGDVRFFQ